MIHNRTIFQKGLILVSVPLFFQLAFIGLLVRMQRQNAEAQELSARSQEVLTEAHSTLTLLVDAETALRGWVATDDLVFGEPYGQAARELPERLARFRALIKNPDQQTRAGRIEELAAQIMAWHAENERMLRGGERERVIGRIKTAEGKRRMDDVRREMGSFLQAQAEIDAAREQALEKAKRGLNWLLLAGGLAAVLTTSALAYVFNRGISGRLALLTDNVRRLARGEELASAAAGRDEIARLDQDFREMAAELARSRQSLHDQMQILQSVLDSMGDGVVVADQAGRFLIFNPAAARLFGKGKTDSPPEQWSREYGLYLPDGRTPLPEDQIPLLRAIRGEAVNDVDLLVRYSGAEQDSWVTVTGRPLGGSNGELRGGVVVCRDVTERKRAEEALRRFNDELEARVRDRTAELTTAVAQLRDEVAERERVEVRLRSLRRQTDLLLSAAGEGIYGLDRAGITTFVNPAAAALTGWAVEELVGQHQHALTHHTRPDGSPYPPEECLIYAAIRDRTARRVDDEVFWRKDRTSFPVEYVSNPVLDEDGAVLGAVVVFKDVTERKRAEAEIRRRAAELAEANRDLAQKNTENEMFVYSVSHDLRSPLVNLQGFSKELGNGCQQIAAVLDEAADPASARDRVRSLLDGKMAKSLGFIQSAVLRLSTIIDALLRLSRAGRVEYRWEAVDLAGVVTRVVDASHGTAAEKQARIEVGELPPVWGDGSALEQVFANLVGNALVYLDPARPGEIEVGCLPARENGFRTYYVRDNGLGIAEGHQAKIFQMFQRAHPGVGKGEGIGLAIVARVAERHRGKVWVESRAGEGSTFFVTLPTDPGKGPTR